MSKTYCHKCGEWGDVGLRKCGHIVCDNCAGSCERTNGSVKRHLNCGGIAEPMPQNKGYYFCHECFNCVPEKDVA